MNKLTTGTILVDALILAGIYFFYFKIRNKKTKDIKNFDAFYFENDEFCLNSPVKKWSCKKEDIDYIKFTYKKGSFGIYRGFGEIFRKDTEVVQKFMFDGSVYLKKAKLITREKDIIKSIEYCKEILNKNNVKYKEEN